MKRLLLLIGVLLLCVATSRADEVEVRVEVPELLESLEGITRPAERFAVYEQFIISYGNEPEKRLRCAQMMLEEAETHHDERHMALAYLYYAYYAYNMQDFDQVRVWADKLEPLAVKNHYYDLLFKGQECVADLLLNNNHYEQAEQKAIEILTKAQQIDNIPGMIIGYRCLGRIYNGTYRGDESVKLFEKAYRLAEQIDDSKAKLEILNFLVYIHQVNLNFGEWLRYLRINETELMRCIREDATLAPLHKGDLLLLYLSYLYYYTKTDNPAKAKHYKALVDEHYTDEFLLYQYDYAKAMISYHSYTTEWEKALEAIEDMLALTRQFVPRNYPIFLQNKADVLHLLGRDEEALAVLRESLFVKDTMQLSIYKTQVDQIKSTYDTNQYMLHQSAVRRSFQFAGLGVVALIIVVMVILARKSSRMRDTLLRSEQELLRIASEVDKASQIKERFLSNISYAIQMPLNEVVDNSLMLTSEEEISEEQRSHIASTILHTTDQLMILVEEILDLSRLESGRMKFALSDVDVQMQLLNLAGGIPDGHLEWISPFDVSEPIWVTIDGKRFTQVLSTLLAYREGTVRVELSMENAQTLSMKVTNPALLEIETVQEAIIRNEICRMIILHFGGHYEVTHDRALLTLQVKPAETAPVL